VGAVGEEDVGRALHALAGAARGLIVAGPVPDPARVGPAVLALGAATGFPVLADPLSGARFAPPRGARVVDGYDLFLRSPQAKEALAPDLVLRVGASPTSAPLLEYLAGHGDARQLVVDDGHRWKDHLAAAHEYVLAPPAAFLAALAAGVARAAGGSPLRDPAWSALWEEASRRTRRVLAGAAGGELLEGEILAAVCAALPEGSNLLVGSSMPIRDLDAFAAPAPKRLRVFGNRGVSGIDGLVSTTLGIAAASPAPDAPGAAPPPTVGVLGDLAFLHDLNGLLALKTLGLRAVLVVINNDGGGIFHTLPVREHEPAFTRFFATPHGLELGRAAQLFGIPHLHVAGLRDLRERLAGALEAGGPAILEVRTRREATHARRREVIAEVVAAVEPLGAAEEPRSPSPPS
jgi:2-succinyl-5-enolpyruvyl-6-hydroxy-3-cyclohexene-1-carboxylate synthase